MSSYLAEARLRSWLSEAQLDAGERLARDELGDPRAFRAALAALRPMHAIVHAVVCRDLSPVEWADMNGYDAKAGLTLLRFALDTLAGFYGRKGG